MNKELYTNSPEETEKLAAEMALELAGNQVVLLSGDLGSGKTTFTRGMAVALGIAESEVSSPSYTLINEYYGESKRLIHVDLYRLGDEQEALELALEDMLDDETLMIIEWGERLPQGFPKHLELSFSVSGDNERRISIRKP